MRTSPERLLMPLTRLFSGQRGHELGGGVAAVEQVADVRLGAAQRLERGHALQRLAARDVEDDRVPGGGGDRVRVLLQAPTAEVGPGVLWRVGDRPRDVLLVEQALDPAGGRPACCTGRGRPGRRSTAGRRAAAWGGSSRGRPCSGSRRSAAAWSPSRASPASCIGSSASVASTDSQRSSTSAVRSSTSRAEPVLGVLAGQFHVLHLDLDRGELPAVAQRDQVTAGRVVRDRAKLGDGAVDREVGAAGTCPRSSTAPARSMPSLR